MSRRLKTVPLVFWFPHSCRAPSASAMFVSLRRRKRKTPPTTVAESTFTHSLESCEEDLLLVKPSKSSTTNCAMAAVEEKVHAPRRSPKFLDELTSSPKSEALDLPRNVPPADMRQRDNSELWVTMHSARPSYANKDGLRDTADQRTQSDDSTMGLVIEASSDTLSGQVQALGRHALEGVPTLLRTLEALARVHPFVELAFIPFKLLYHLETKRRDNDHRRAALFTVIKDAMLALVELEYFTEDYTAYRTTPAGQKIKSRIVAVCEQMQKDIHGCYNELSAHDRSAPAIHFVRAVGRNKILADYGARFKATREDLVFALQIENALAVNKMRHMLEEQLIPKTTPSSSPVIPATRTDSRDPPGRPSLLRLPTYPPDILSAQDEWKLNNMMDPTSAQSISNSAQLSSEIECLSQIEDTSWKGVLALRQQLLLGQSRGLKFHNDVGRDRPPGPPESTTTTSRVSSALLSMPRSQSFSTSSAFPSPQLPPYTRLPVTPGPGGSPRTPPMYWDFELEAGGYFANRPPPRNLLDPRLGTIAPWGESPSSTVVGDGSPFVVGLDISGAGHSDDSIYRTNIHRGWSLGAVSQEIASVFLTILWGHWEQFRRINLSQSSTATGTTAAHTDNVDASDSDADSDNDDGTVIGDSDSDDGPIYMRSVPRKQMPAAPPLQKTESNSSVKFLHDMPGFLKVDVEEEKHAEPDWPRIVTVYFVVSVATSIRF
ncbi:hypothetical protein MIND_01270500 [Mycena indigotica]|uniref:Uncharacterized protein n=1 Tax=Mycena indigotica TaxID=2126181 RepID=A0A8H6S3P2_9AGAR|nr:uncharacterized protein MIND_01270500 [Mycena indigotica]KAF7291267.1 hypothetical protein MIND_01270500 [Mycena indigotica]